MLPLVSYEDYEKVYGWPVERFTEVLESLRVQHALPRTVWRRFPLGRNLVFALGEAFALKLVPPFWAHDAAREAEALRAVHGRLSVSTPELIASGRLGGEGSWAYLVTCFVRGRQIGWAFGDLTEAERVTLARQQGALVAEVRALSLSEAEQNHLAFSWSRLLAEQRAGLTQELTVKGMPEVLVKTAGAYVDAAGDLATGTARLPHPVFLHGDLSCANLVLDPGSPKIVGLLDFSDASFGPADHEFISPVMHQFLGEARVLYAFWEGAEVERGNDQLEHRAMARSLLYYADTVGRYLERLLNRGCGRAPLHLEPTLRLATSAAETGTNESAVTLAGVTRQRMADRRGRGQPKAFIARAG